MNEIIKVIDVNYLIKLSLILLIIGLLSLSNILGGIYYNVGKKKELFNKDKLFNGLIKIFIVIFIVTCLTIAFLIFNYLELINNEIVDPFIIMYAVSVYYFVKVIKLVCKIFNVNLNKLIDKEVIED